MIIFFCKICSCMDNRGGFRPWGYSTAQQFEYLPSTEEFSNWINWIIMNTLLSTASPVCHA